MELPDRLTLRGLRIFVALEEAQSVARAAERLNLSKSSISQHITGLEDSIGTTLFDRRQKPIALTATGQVLSAHAHRILGMVSEAEAALAVQNAGCLPVLNFAIIDDLDISLTPAISTALHEQLPQSYICTFSGRSDEVTNRLSAREADIAISASVPDDVSQFQIRELFSERFALVVAKGRYMQNKDWRAQLTALPLIEYSESMPIGRLVLTHLKRTQFEVPRRLSFETSRSVIATVAKTGGWTLATPLSILDASRFHDQIEIFPLPFAELSRSVFLINRMHELSSIADTLFQTLQYLLRRDLLSELDRIAPELSERLTVHDLGNV